MAKVDAVLKANIANINDLTIPSAFTGLLDTYTGAAAGYSTRRLASSATNLMRIREDSGDTETDIGYDSNGDLDTAAIATHCGTANGYIVTWYDQSGNSNDATQSTAGSQPQIYNGTAVITDNGKPAISMGILRLTSFIDTQLYSFFFVNGLGNAYRTIFLRNSGASTYLRADNANRYVIVTPTDFDFLSGSTFDGTQALNSLIVSSSTTATSFQNGAQTGTISSLGGGNMKFDLLEKNMTLPGTPSTLFTQEMIFYTSDVGSTNRTGIETNINAYFQIF
mgnify:FL=1